MEDIKLLYDSQQTEYKRPFGALKRKESCRICVRIPRRLAALNVFFLLQPDEKEESALQMAWNGLDEQGYDRYQISFSLPECGLYFYHFAVENGENKYTFFRQEGCKTSIGSGEKWQLTCFAEEYHPPQSFYGTVMYQIFPDRFYHETLCDSKEKLSPFWVHAELSETPAYLPDAQGIVQNNDFYGGNLEGIRKKLPYLRALGVDVLYLNPIFMAYSNHRYDTADYLRVDPLLGTEEDFKQLCQEAHRHGMRVILDGVFSHTGSNSVYFDKENVFQQGAYHHPDSPFRKWYDFQQYPHQYTSWWGIDTLPCVKEETPSYLDFIIRSENSVIAHWLRCGADGFRLDVADELPDSFIRLLTDRVKQINPDAIVIGEVWEDASNKISYGKRRTYFTHENGPQLDSVMNYPFRNAIIELISGRMDPSLFRSRILSIAENYPKPILHLLMNSLSTHDTPRILSLLGKQPAGISKREKADFKMQKEDFDIACKRLKAAVFLQFFLPGIPCIYYGDEIGMEGFEDPFNRRYYDWENRNRELFSFYQDMIRLHRRIPPMADLRFEEANNLVLFHRGSFTILCNPTETSFLVEQHHFCPLYLQDAKTEETGVRLLPYGCALLQKK